MTDMTGMDEMTEMTEMTDTGDERATDADPVPTPAGSFVSADVTTVDADGRELPEDVAAWIDEHDPVIPRLLHDGDGDGNDRDDGDEVPDVVDALEEQRAEHEPPSREATEAIGPLVNNTGDDGGAASG